MTRNLRELFEEFTIYDAEGDDLMDSFIDEGDNSIMVVPVNGNENQFTFDLDAPVTYTEDGFSAYDRNGDETTFTAFIMRRVKFDAIGDVQ